MDLNMTGVCNQRVQANGLCRSAVGIWTVVLSWVVALLWAGGLPAQNPPVEARVAQWTEADDQAVVLRVERAQAKQQIPGLSVAIARDGVLRFARGFGQSDLEHRVPTTDRTRFRTASIAKSMTAVALMQLFDAGKVDLDVPVSQYVSRWPKKRWPIPVRLLLGHLGGVRHYSRPGESSGTRHFRSVASSLQCFSADPLLHEPGSKYQYTTYGYTLLGCAVEQVSGLSYERYLTESVWKPAGMVHTCIDAEDRVILDRARGYRKRKTLADRVGFGSGEVRVVPAALHDTSMKIPGGGLRSTASDLVRFGLAMLDDTLVRPGTRALMWTSLQTTAGRQTGYGLGFGVGRLDGESVIGHGGAQAGTACLLRLLPKQKAVVAVMTNLEGAKLGVLVRDLLQIARDGRK